jgi:hypothetical protein
MSGLWLAGASMMAIAGYPDHELLDFTLCRDTTN